MADQGIWFKLWGAALTDPDLGSLSIDDFGRWCKLGLLVKVHGTNGTIKIRSDSTILAQLSLPDMPSFVKFCNKCPNLLVNEEVFGDVKLFVTPVTITTVTFRKWHRYQGDMSNRRVQKHRALKQLRGYRKEDSKEDSKEEDVATHLLGVSGNGTDRLDPATRPPGEQPARAVTPDEQPDSFSRIEPQTTRVGPGPKLETPEDQAAWRLAQIYEQRNETPGVFKVFRAFSKSIKSKVLSAGALEDTLMNPANAGDPPWDLIKKAMKNGRGAGVDHGLVDKLAAKFQQGEK